MAKRIQTRLGAKIIDGARPSEMPGFIKPQLATLRSKAPKGDQWLHEIKYDGYRIQIHLNNGKRKVYTRNGLDWTKRFSVIAGALDIPGQAILDGEVVVIKDGRTNFSELQVELAAGNQDRLVFYAFDLLYIDGLNLRRSPQIERKRVLKALLDGFEGSVLYSEHLVGDGQEMFEHAAKLNWEGIVSKNADAPYRSDRNEGWLKIKTSQRAKFPTPPAPRSARSACWPLRPCFPWWRDAASWRPLSARHSAGWSSRWRRGGCARRCGRSGGGGRQAK